MRQTSNKRVLVYGAAVVFAVVFACVAFTITDAGMGWDEANDIRMATDAAEWFRGMAAGEPGSFSRQTIERYWGFEWVQHPAATRVYYALLWPAVSRFGGGAVAREWISFRYLSAALFAALAAGVFVFGAARFGAGAGAAAAVSLLCMPRMFGHAHFVETDLMLCAVYFAAAAAFLKGLESRRGAVLFGILAGLLPAVKFTGLLAPAAFFLYGIIFERGKLRANAVAAAVIAPIVFVAVQPMYWHGPVGAAAEYARHFLAPGARATIMVHYFGRDYAAALPWSYPFVISALSVPVAILAAGAAGAALGLWRRGPEFASARKTVVFMLINSFFMLCVFAPPRVSVYDGERLLTAVFPFWALLAGAGMSWALARFSTPLRAAGIAVFAIWCGVVLAESRPFHLIYYNELAGGVAGAERRGLEVMYWGEAFTPGMAALMNRTLPPGSRVVTVGYYKNNLAKFQELGLLRADIKPETYGREADFLLAFNRRGVMDAHTRALWDRSPPLAAVNSGGTRVAALFILRPGLDLMLKTSGGGAWQPSAAE
jgi:4-amino-4-deoxy-L-arabinose transferase-like glycosyltransferase